jgi:acyl-CoA thioesterase
MFAKAASWDFPMDISLETCRRGKSFSVVTARLEQGGRLCSVAQFLLDSGAPDEFRLVAAMPAVPGPHDSTPLDMGVTGRELRVVGNAYSRRGSEEPDNPEISVWLRFRQDPAEVCLRQALIAQATTHWLGAAAMRALPGWDLAGAHTKFSGAPMSVALAFHDDADVSDWLLYSNIATYGGRGLTFGEARVFTRDGRLAASFCVQGMMRSFARDPASLGIAARHAI